MVEQLSQQSVHASKIQQSWTIPLSEIPLLQIQLNTIAFFYNTDATGKLSWLQDLGVSDKDKAQLILLDVLDANPKTGQIFPLPLSERIQTMAAILAELPAQQAMTLLNVLYNNEAIRGDIFNDMADDACKVALMDSVYVALYNKLNEKWGSQIKALVCSVETRTRQDQIFILQDIQQHQQPHHAIPSINALMTRTGSCARLSLDGPQGLRTNHFIDMAITTTLPPRLTRWLGRLK